MPSSPVLVQASWIASPIAGGKRTCAPVPFVRKSFHLGQPVRSAQLAVTALGLYECEINGHRIGTEVFAPGWTDYNKRVQYQTYDVTGLLHAGENVLGAILGDGWYCGWVGWFSRQIYGDRPRLLAQLEVTLADGSSVVIGTDASWKTTTGPILESDIMLGESYDARLELGAWSQPNYDDSQWQPVLLLPPASPIEVVPRVGPPVRRIEEIKPVKTSQKDEWTGDFRTYDFGQNFSGRIRLRIKAKPGTCVKITYAEILNPNGTLYTENLRGARCTDYYTCRSNDYETWEPLFTFHGFRYVDVTFPKNEDEIEVTGIVLHSDTPPTGTFRCSHEGLNQLQHNIVWGQKSNFLEVPTDCPQRDERLGWTGDAQVFARTAAFNMDVRMFFHKWMQDARDAQYAGGEIPCVIPVPWKITPDLDGGPAWSDANVICPWTMYLCYGDKKILEDHYESMQRYLAYLGKDRCLGNIRNHPDKVEWGGFGDWLALDGGGRIDGITPHDLIGTAYYAYDAEIMSKIADVLGRPDDAKMYRALRAEIGEAFQRRYITPEGIVGPGTQTSYVLALKFGLVDESNRATAVRELVRHFEKKSNFHLATGFVGTSYVLDVLEDANHLDLAYKILEQETFPSWLFPVRNGATTIWERWDGWTPDKGFQDKGMNSFNHYAYGAVGAWMYKSMAGLDLDPEQPGYAHILFRPRPGGTITWAEATLQTQFGLAGIRWDLEGEKLQVQLTVPAGAHATFQPPASYDAKETSYAAGTHRLSLTRKI